MCICAHMHMCVNTYLYDGFIFVHVNLNISQGRWKIASWTRSPREEQKFFHAMGSSEQESNQDFRKFWQFARSLNWVISNVSLEGGKAMIDLVGIWPFCWKDHYYQVSLKVVSCSSLTWSLTTPGKIICCRNWFTVGNKNILEAVM